MKNIKSKTILTFTIITIALFINGCSQKTQIKAIKSGKVLDNNIKYIGVSTFKNDNVSQSSQIDSAISSVSIDGKKYFNLVDRKNIKRVMYEKRLNDSGLVDLVNNNSSTGLTEMKSLVTGNIDINSISTLEFQEERTDFNTCIESYERKGKTYCKEYRKYKVNCQTNQYNLQTKIKIIKIENSSTLFAKTYKTKSAYKHCSDDKNILPNKRSENTRLAGIVANKLILDIAPSYIYFNATLLDDLDIELNDKQENIFDNSLTMIKHKRIKKANQMLSKLNNQLNQKSFVVLYNLAITYESLGDIQKAYQLLEKAENISLEVGDIIEEISIAIRRVKNNLIEKQKVLRQI